MAQPELKVRDGAAVWREIEGETVVLALDTSLYLGLNGTATALWSELTEGATREHLVDVLEERYGVDRARAAADVHQFVEACRAQELLEGS